MRSPANPLPTPRPVAPGGLDRGHTSFDAHSPRAPADLDGDQASADSQATGVPASSNGTDLVNREAQVTAVGAESSPGQQAADTLNVSAGALSNGTDHEPRDAHRGPVGAEPSSNGHVAHDTQRQFAVGSDGNGRTRSEALTTCADPSDALLVILADQLDDIEKARIAAENRLRSLAQVKGLDAGSKAAVILQVIIGEWVAAEKRITLELQRAMRAHRFGPWVAGNVGLGEKQAGRLIAAIGDPYMRPRLEREDGTVEEARPRRGPAELWAYCGYRPDQGKRKGQLHAYNWEAKMRAFLCAESCKRQRCGACTEASKARKVDGDTSWAAPPAGCTCAADGFPFRVVYDRERLKWVEREVPDAHKEAHALRVVAKEILKSLWRYAAADDATSLRETPAATGQLRAAKGTAISASIPPPDLPATTHVATPGPAPSPVSLEVV